MKRLFAWLRKILCRTNEHKDYYFVAGEVIFQVQHPKINSPEEARQKVLDAISGFLSGENGGNEQQNDEYKQVVEGNWRGRLQPPDKNTPVITFSTGENEPFSIVPLRVAGHHLEDPSPDSVLDVLESAYAEIRSSLEENPLHLQDGISLISLSPNWIAGGLHHGPATGGPGSLPDPTNAAATKFEFVRESTESLDTYKNKLSGQKYVTILDTIPTAAVGDEAQAMIAASQFNIIGYPDQTEIAKLRLYTPEPEHYRMSNHGTFIASIVRSIAPNATIHLRQVLNEYGCGSFLTIAQGLQNALVGQQSQGYALIINCSFMLNLNLGDLDHRMQLLSDPATRVILERSMRDVFHSAATTRNVIVVAAAGNDSQAGTRKNASYPAAFKKVLGVGALPKDYPLYPRSLNYSGRYIPASYSNFSFSAEDGNDRSESFMTFGGEVAHGTQTPIQGVGGAYFGEFPEYASNGTYSYFTPQSAAAAITGRAHWSGTSFAAPIITGLLVARDNELQYYLPNPALPIPFSTRENENVIVARQI